MNARLRTSPSNSRGFTLVELLMAMLILTVGLLGLLQSIEIAFQHDARNKLREEAVLLAEEQLNGMKVLGYDLITSNHTFRIDRPIAGGTRSFSVTKSYLEMGGDGGKKSKKLTVAVAWSFRNASTTHTIYTVKSE